MLALPDNLLSLYLNAPRRAEETFYLFSYMYVQEGDSEMLILFTVGKAISCAIMCTTFKGYM